MLLTTACRFKPRLTIRECSREAILSKSNERCLRWSRLDCGSSAIRLLDQKILWERRRQSGSITNLVFCAAGPMAAATELHSAIDRVLTSATT